MSKIYIVEAQGFGDNEDEFVNIGNYTTRAKAEAKVAEVTNYWIEDNGDTEGLELRIAEYEVDA